MTEFYSARGNIYGVIEPAALRAAGIALPADAVEAAASRVQWTRRAIEATCHWPAAVPQARRLKPHRSDGLLVGPFQARSPFEVLILNTDGTFAERSGNGLTIFAQSLVDRGFAVPGEAFTVHVTHDNPATVSPVVADIDPARLDGDDGFWVDMGRPQFGPDAVGARPGTVDAVDFGGRTVSRVRALTALDPAWARSVFVRVGNPHCVTLVADMAQLPDMAAMSEGALHDGLARIAYAEGSPAHPGVVGSGEPCPRGVNLQWATPAPDGGLAARIFERGEGPTQSSGSSATAVACAGWHVGLVPAGRVLVRMPGGTAPIDLVEEAGDLVGARLFGVAVREVSTSR